MKVAAAFRSVRPVSAWEGCPTLYEHGCWAGKDCVTRLYQVVWNTLTLRRHFKHHRMVDGERWHARQLGSCWAGSLRVYTTKHLDLDSKLWNFQQITSVTTAHVRPDKFGFLSQDSSTYGLPDVSWTSIWHICNCKGSRNVWDTGLLNNKAANFVMDIIFLASISSRGFSVLDKTVNINSFPDQSLKWSMNFYQLWQEGLGLDAILSM